MVLKSGNESIVRYGWEGVRGYYIGAGVLVLVSLGLLAIGLDEAGGQGILALASSEYFWAGLACAWMALMVYRNGRTLSHAFVAVGPDGVRLRLLKDVRSRVFALRPEQRFKWEEIGKITCVRGSCVFRAGSGLCTLDENCPSPPAVAQLMAEWKGVELPSQQSTEPPRT